MKLTKSKQFLADAIHASGNGWPDGTHWAAQDGDGTGSVDFFAGSKPRLRKAERYWCGDFDCDNRIHKCEKTSPNWHQCVLSREEYFSAYPEEPVADADGWIEWKGGECPVGEDDLIDVKFSDGDELFCVDSIWDWGVDADGCNIIAYRLHKLESKPDFCESVTRSIPEPYDAKSRLSSALELVKAAAPHLLIDKYKFSVEEVMGGRKPSIEQLAAEYRNKLGYAERLQKEADAAKDDAKAKLADLVEAGKEHGLVVSIAGNEPELVITDWRDLQVGDEVQIIGSLSGDGVGEIGVVTRFDEDDKGGEVRVHFNGNEGYY